MRDLDRAREHAWENPGHVYTGDEIGGYYCLSCEWPPGDLDAALERRQSCRVTEMVNGTEFICVLDVHDDGKKPDQFDSRGEAARWRRHLFRRRYPYAGSH